MRLLQLDDLLTPYTSARPEASLFLRLPRSSRLQLRCGERTNEKLTWRRLGWTVNFPFAENNRPMFGVRAHDRHKKAVFFFRSRLTLPGG
jgi:hypothetical protein